MCRSIVDIHSATTEIRQGKKKEDRKQKKPQGKNIMACPIQQGGHKQQTLTLTLHQPHQWKQWSKRPGDNPFSFRYPFHNQHHFPLQLIFGQRMTARNDHISIFSSFLISCCMTSLWSPYGIGQTIIFSS